MVTRTSEAAEAPPPVRPFSRAAPPAAAAPGTPTKPRLGRLNTSPTKREEKNKEDRGAKTSAKDVAELKDYVWRWFPLAPPLPRAEKANGLMS